MTSPWRHDDGSVLGKWSWRLEQEYGHDDMLFACPTNARNANQGIFDARMREVQDAKAHNHMLGSETNPMSDAQTQPRGGVGKGLV